MTFIYKKERKGVKKMTECLVDYAGEMTPRGVCAKVARTLGLGPYDVQAQAWIVHENGTRSVAPSDWKKIAPGDQGQILVKTLVPVDRDELTQAVESALSY